jgi:circadian clock protein KaiB
MPKFQLSLYITGKTTRAERTIANLRRMLDEEAIGDYELCVCDVLEEPQTAERYKVLATPTLILTSPAPARWVVGDISDKARVFQYLGMPLRAKRVE